MTTLLCNTSNDTILMQTSEASRVFEHLVSKGVKPNVTTYSVLVDANLIGRDPKAALSIIDQMVIASLCCELAFVSSF